MTSSEAITKERDNTLILNILTRVDTSVDRIDRRQTSLEDRMHNIEQVMSANTASLQEHMRRTHSLETLVSEVRKENVLKEKEQEERSRDRETQESAKREAQGNRLLSLETRHDRIVTFTKWIGAILAFILTTALALFGAYAAGKGKFW